MNDMNSNDFPHHRRRNTSNVTVTEDDKLCDNSIKFNNKNTNTHSHPGDSKHLPTTTNTNKDNDILIKILSPPHPPKQLAINTSSHNSKHKRHSVSTHSPKQTPTFTNTNFLYNGTFTPFNPHNVASPADSFHSNTSPPSHVSSSSLSLITTNQIIPSSFTLKHPSLLLEEINGNSLSGNKVIITPCGYIHSKRNYGDGFVFFGPTYVNSNTNQIVNDVVITLPKTNSVNAPAQGEHFFTIYFNLNLLTYFIRPFRSHTDVGFVLVKLDTEYKLHSQEYFVIADYVFRFVRGKEDEEILITKMPSKHDSEELVYKFVPQQGKITIGRNKNCSISFAKNKNFSQVHSCVAYDKAKSSWVITDGGDVPSLNGTWLMLKHSYEIRNECVFKTAWNSKYVIKYINTN